METAPEPIEPRNQCRHIHIAGTRCGSPSLRRENFCFYHHTTRRPIPNHHTARYPDADLWPFLLPVLEDRASIQLAIAQVVGRIASNDLDIKRGRTLLFGLQIALRALAPEPGRDRNGRYSREEKDEILDLNQVEQDPILGPLAPIAPHTPPEERKGLAQRLLEELRNRRCSKCKQEPTPQESQDPPQPETIPTIQAVAQLAHSSNLIPHSRKLKPGAPSFAALSQRVGYRAKRDRSLPPTTNPARATATSHPSQ